jgi:hypothetical protein
MVGDQRDVLPWLQALDLFALPSYANEGCRRRWCKRCFAGCPA